MRRVTRSAVSVAQPSAANDRGGGPSLRGNPDQEGRPASSVGDVSGRLAPLWGWPSSLLLPVCIAGSEEPQKLETTLAVGEGGRVVDVKREDCPTLTNALDLDPPPADHSVGEDVLREPLPKGGRPATCTSDMDACGALIHKSAREENGAFFSRNILRTAHTLSYARYICPHISPFRRPDPPFPAYA